MSDITKHKWSDKDVNLAIDGPGLIEICFDGRRVVESIHVNEDDSIAIAKHFKHYRDTEKLDFIAKQLQSWIDFSKQEDENSHIIPPMWPTKCQLENWIKVLSGNNDQ